MPDVVVHYLFGEQVRQRLPDEIAERLNRPIFDLALNGPDDWSMYRFWCIPLRHGIQRRSNKMHYEKCGEFLVSMAERTRASQSGEELFSYLCGYLCHYALDQTTHPFINAHCGIYDRSAETARFRGRHMLYEHALDLRALEQQGLTLRQRPITRRMMQLRRLPVSMRADLDALYRSVYGWENAWHLLNRCRRDMRWIYFISEDPYGLLYFALRRIRRFRPDLLANSYYKNAYVGLDIANERHARWHHPKDEAIVSEASFDELTALAGQKAVSWIQSAYAFVYGDAVTAERFASAIGRADYVTGWELEDPRQNNRAGFYPLEPAAD